MYNKETDMYEGYIYLITNTINNNGYVGQTIQTLEVRFQQHVNTALRDETSYMLLHRAMKKYGVDKFNIKLLEKYTNVNKRQLIDTLNMREQYYIDKYNTMKPNGYNMILGGKNGVSEECLSPIDVYTLYGDLIGTFDSIIDGANLLCNGIVNNISACCRGVKMSAHCFVWRYCGDAFDKFPITEDHIQRTLLAHGRISICKYTTDGILLSSFKSFTDAEKDLGLSRSRTPIAMCCKGQAKSAYGFIWRYSNQPFDIFNHIKDGKFIKVNQYSTDDVFVRTFASLKEAEMITGINHSSISSCIYKKCNTAGGFKWYRADDTDQPDKSKIITSN